ncbi:MAG: site-specific integrase [Candidatus Acidiferrales bacterium]|jgi:integrase
MNDCNKRLPVRFAVKKNLWTGDNPCKGIDQNEEPERDRFLQRKELPQFLAALASDLTPPDLRDLVLVSLFTGARSGNVFAMRWAELDLDGGVWRIPRKKTKNRKGVQNVPLAPEVVSLIQRRRERGATGSEWIFPTSKQNGGDRYHAGHITEVTRQWKRLLKRAGIEDLRFHDLRRSLASWQAEAGVSLQIIAATLGHSSTDATEIYARLNLIPVRQAVNGAVTSMLETGGVSRKLLTGQD